jgi:aspartate-semialdehyde dehydrogenase
MSNLIIVGASGLVGQSFINLVEKSNLNFNNYYFITSERSEGKTIVFKNNEYKYILYSDDIFKKDEINFIINCADKNIAERLMMLSIKDNNIVIDNSNAFRMKEDIPLVVPHINMLRNNYIANPNCSTIILCCLLQPLRMYKFKRLVISTYQAASGAGLDGLEELKLQQKELVEEKELTTTFWGKQYVNNCFVHNTKIQDNFYNEEENKLINETSKIMGEKVNLTVTCIRVPVYQSHCLSVNIEFENEITYNNIIENILLDENLVLMDNKQNNIFPETLSSTNNEKVYVGHIRPDLSLPKNKGWNFWISGDQILRGASYNAFKILEKLSGIKSKDFNH